VDTSSGFSWRDSVNCAENLLNDDGGSTVVRWAYNRYDHAIVGILNWKGILRMSVCPCIKCLEGGGINSILAFFFAFLFYPTVKYVMILETYFKLPRKRLRLTEL
jgi:hypothetical protein